MNPMRDEWIVSIEEVLDNFEWEKVKCSVEALGWEYGSGDAAHRPTYSKLRKTAKRLLMDVVCTENHPHWIRSGGFLAESYFPGHVALNFVIEYSEAGYGDEEPKA